MDVRLPNSYELLSVSVVKSVFNRKMKESKTSAKRTKINGVFVLFAKLSVSCHALG